MKKGLIFATVALALMTTAVASQAARPGSRMNAQDRHFITQACQGNTSEVQLGQLAVSKRDGRRVQQFGQRMIQDHSAALNKLMSVAADEGVKLPTDPPSAMGAEGRATYDRLAGLSGSRFSQAYMAAMVSDHQKDVSAFKREIRHGSDPNVRAYARATLPVIEQHLSMAGDLYAMVNGGSGRMYAHRRMKM
jgi:putative membrane protein